MNSLKIFFLSILLVTLIGCGGSGGGDHTDPDLHTVEYEVSTSSQDVSITYIDGDGKTVNLPGIDSHNSVWNYIFSAKNGDHLALSAQLLGSVDDTVHVTIFLDNQEVAHQMSYSVDVMAQTEYDIPTSN
jgi:hypothetical protein